MARTSKLKNTEAIQKMLDGSHRFQTRKTMGFSDTEAVASKNESHEVGDIWYETNPITGVTYKWEQKEGYRVKVQANLEEGVKKIRSFLSSFPNCPKEECTCINPKRIDHVFRKKTGMCEDCTISHETKLKINGGFKEYALEKMRANAESFFREADKEVEEIKKGFEKIEFVLEEGEVEKWSMNNKEEILERIGKDYDEFKKEVLEAFSEKDSER